MGTDIHLYIEIDSGDQEPFSDDRFIDSFSDGDIYISRDYPLFGALAGVRHYGDGESLIPPKGIPGFLSNEVNKEYFDYVFDEGEKYWNEDYTKREHAEEYVKRGVSEYKDHHQKEKGWVSNPDWHTPSYLGINEIRKALNHVKLYDINLPIEFKIVMTTLEAIEREYGVGRSRIVFWFDN